MRRSSSIIYVKRVLNVKRFALNKSSNGSETSEKLWIVQVKARKSFLILINRNSAVLSCTVCGKQKVRVASGFLSSRVGGKCIRSIESTSGKLQFHLAGRKIQQSGLIHHHTKMKYLQDFRVLELLYVLIFYISKVDALKCFQCDALDPGCATLTKQSVKSPYLVDCRGHPNPFCRKTIQTIFDSDNLVRISRSCGWIRKSNDSRCFRDDNDFRFDWNCQCFEDGCNSAPSMVSQQHLWPLLIAGLVLLYQSLSVF